MFAALVIVPPVIVHAHDVAAGPLAALPEDSSQTCEVAVMAGVAGFAFTVMTMTLLVAGFPDLGSPYKHGARRVFSKKFKFPLVYVADENEILILAVASFRRKPGYWKSRGR